MKKLFLYFSSLLFAISTLLVIFCDNKITNYLYLFSNVFMCVIIICIFIKIKKVWIRIIAIIGEILSLLNAVFNVFFNDFLFEHYHLAFIIKIVMFVIVLIVSYYLDSIGDEESDDSLELDEDYIAKSEYYSERD